jgi:hypothetical protein
MANACKVCASEHRAEVDKMMRADEAPKDIIERMALEYGLPLERRNLTAHRPHLESDPRVIELREFTAEVAEELRGHGRRQRFISGMNDASGAEHRNDGAVNASAFAVQTSKSSLEDGEYSPTVFARLFQEAAELTVAASEGRGANIDALTRSLETIARYRNPDSAHNFTEHRLWVLWEKHRYLQGRSDVRPEERTEWQDLLADARSAPLLSRPLYVALMREHLTPVGEGNLSKLLKAAEAIMKMTSGSADSEQLEFAAAFGAAHFERFK